MKSSVKIEVIVSNDHGLQNRVELGYRAAYDLLYMLTGNGQPRDYKGTREGTQYTIKVIT